MCAVRVGGQELLASASNDKTVRIWDPATSRVTHTLTGHTGRTSAVCAARVGGRELLALACDDRTVQVWDPDTGKSVLSIPSHHEALACANVFELLIIGVSAGLLAVHIGDPPDPPT